MEDSIFEDTITITFGDQAENHAGMQKIGVAAEEGYSVKELDEIFDELKELGDIDAEIVYIDYPKIARSEDPPKDINDVNEGKEAPAAILIIRDGLKKLFNVDPDDLYEEQKKLNPDTKAYMRGKVVNKKARYNLCFSDEGQKADFENKKGTIIRFKDVKLLNRIRKKLKKYFGEKAEDLQAEGNYYYDLSDCGIGYHGDSERMIVIAIRLGATMPLRYQWFHRFKAKGRYYTFELNHGDMYIMSSKAVGYDWKKSSIWTLRHAAGCDKFIQRKK